MFFTSVTEPSLGPLSVGNNANLPILGSGEGKCRVYLLGARQPRGFGS